MTAWGIIFGKRTLRATTTLEKRRGKRTVDDTIILFDRKAPERMCGRTGNGKGKIQAMRNDASPCRTPGKLKIALLFFYKLQGVDEIAIGHCRSSKSIEPQKGSLELAKLFDKGKILLHPMESAPLSCTHNIKIFFHSPF